MSKFKANQLIRCGTCGHSQRVLHEAIYKGDDSVASGRRPVTETVPAVELPPNRKDTNAPETKPQTSKKPEAITPEDLSPELSAPGVFDDTRNEKLREDLLESAPPPLPTTPADQPAPPMPVEPRKESLPAPPPDMPDPEEARIRSSGGQRAAIVNGHVIERSDVSRELNRALDALRVRLGRRAYTPEGKTLMMRQVKTLQERVTNRLIDRTLVAQAAESEGIAPAASDVLAQAHRMRASGAGWEDASALMDEARTDLLLREAMQRHSVANHEVPPAEIRAFYEKHARKFRRPHEVRLRALVIYRDRSGRADTRQAPEIAADVVAQLAAGVPFKRLVARYGEDPLHKMGGVFPPGDQMTRVDILAGSVRDLLEGAQAGKPLGPVLLAGSVAFLQIEEEQPARIPPLAEVSAHIHERLRQKAAEEAFDQWLASLRDRAAITRF